MKWQQWLSTPFGFSMYEEIHVATKKILCEEYRSDFCTVNYEKPLDHENEQYPPKIWKVPRGSHLTAGYTGKAILTISLVKTQVILTKFLSFVQKIPGLILIFFHIFLTTRYINKMLPQYYGKSTPAQSLFTWRLMGFRQNLSCWFRL